MNRRELVRLELTPTEADALFLAGSNYTRDRIKGRVAPYKAQSRAVVKLRRAMYRARRRKFAKEKSENGT